VSTTARYKVPHFDAKAEANELFIRLGVPTTILQTALGIFKRGDDFIGKTVSIAGEHLTGNEYAAALTAALGEPVEYRPHSWEEFREFPMPIAVELANMFQFYAEDSDRFTATATLTWSASVITRCPRWGVCARRHRVGVQPDSVTLASGVRPSETTTWQLSARKLARST
jgi:uncharacterized protein YbjT (DUF2867 family)